MPRSMALTFAGKRHMFNTGILSYDIVTKLPVRISPEKQLFSVYIEVTKIMFDIPKIFPPLFWNVLGLYDHSTI